MISHKQVLIRSTLRKSTNKQKNIETSREGQAKIRVEQLIGTPVHLNICKYFGRGYDALEKD